MARILVVDDDPDILKVAEKVLASSGHTVFVAEDALRAIDWLDHIEFDLLLSDANMPHYSGFELIHTVRGNPKFKELSVAMLTGLRERKDVERALKAGVDDYIVKPLDPILLLQKVNALFEKHPPKQYPVVELHDPKLGRGFLKRHVEIISVSELGVQIRTDAPLKPGMVVDVDTPFFEQLGVMPPTMKVLSVDSMSAQLIFLGAHEAFLQKIRRWLYSHGSSLKAI